MKLSFFYTIDTWILSLMQFAIMMVCIKLGQVVGRKSTKNFSESYTTVTSSFYALLGLLLAFTFGMSGDRFKQRRDIITQEVNNIGTAVLRADLYADSVRPKFRENFRQYLEARISYYESNDDTVNIKKAIDKAAHHQQILWQLAADNSKIPSNLVASNQMVPALNQMFDIATSRLWSELNRTPYSILTMLFFLSFAVAFVGGYSSVSKAGFDWFLATGFCLITSLVVFFIIDLDKPRKGIITLDKNQKAMTELRRMFE